MHKKRFTLIGFLLILLILSSCSTTKTHKVLTPEELLIEAEASLAKKKYESAILLLERFIYNYPAHLDRQKATFLLIKTYFASKDYAMTVVEGRDFVKNYSNNEWADDVQYLVARALLEQAPGYQLDQSLTREAVVELNTLIMLYPNSSFIEDAKKSLQKSINKLAKKEFYNGTFYKKMGMYEASIVYFKAILDYYPDSNWIDDALFALSEAYFKLGKFGEASDNLNVLVQSYPKSQFNQPAKDLMQQISVWNGKNK